MIKGIKLNEEDSVVTLLQTAGAGDEVEIAGEIFVLERDLSLGDKLALRVHVSTDQIIKYGVSIGSAICDISKGEWVHLHNMKSNYIEATVRSENE